MQKLQHEKEELIREKERITHEHLQEAYQTNMHLHQRIMQLEGAFQSTERLLCEKEQQICELEEVPKIPVSPDEQLEMKHRLIMATSSNIISLALEHRTVDQTLTYYFNAITATFVQYSIDLT